MQFSEYKNNLIYTTKSVRSLSKTRSAAASLSSRGQVIKQTAVNCFFFYDDCRNRARSLVNFYCQYAGQTHELEIHATRQRARAGNSTICYRKNKLMSVFNASVLLLTMNFVITATLTMLWRNSWSITGQTHKTEQDRHIKNWHQNQNQTNWPWKMSVAGWLMGWRKKWHLLSKRRK